MPLELVREVDEAVETMILTMRRDPAHHQTPGSEEESKKRKETLYRQADIRIRLSSISPIFLALHVRLAEVAYKSPTTSWTFWIGVFLGTVSIPLARKGVPFIENSLSIQSIIVYLAFYHIFSLSLEDRVWIDALCSPIFHYIQEDISDREQLHHTVIGVFLASVYSLTLPLLRATGGSIGGVIAAAFGAFVGVQLVITIILSLYISYASPGLFGPSDTPRWVLVFTFGTQKTLSQFTKLAIRLSGPLSPRLIPTRSPCPATPLVQKAMGLFGPYSWLLPGHIRLLRIEKRQFSDGRIHCQFIVVPLIYAPPYEAISYVWGSPEKEQLITVDNKELLITRSAYEIIARRQSSWQERVVWIDQVCINQQDVREKASQVQIMKDIYTRAFRVTAWLGDSPNAELLQYFFAELHLLNKLSSSSSSSTTATTTKSPLEKLKEKAESIWTERQPHLSALSEFFRNPWFRRVWIIQEVACAKKLYVIYGNVCLDWLHVCRSIAVLLTRELLGILPRSEGEGNVLSVAQRWERSLGIRNADTMMAFRGDINYNKNFTLSWMLNEAIGFESSDARDMVYALLGLTTDDSKKTITPNYEKGNKTASVYTQVMRFFLQQGGGAEAPDSFYVTGIGFSRSGRVTGLPSWVPDWSHSAQIRFVHSGYAAGTGQESRFKVGFDDSDPLVLHLHHGEIFDEVKYLGPVFPQDPGKSRLEEILQLQQDYDEAYALAKTHASAHRSRNGLDHGNEDDSESSESELREAFIRTLVGNKVWGPKGTEFSSEQSTSQYHEYFMDMRHCSETYRQIFRALEEDDRDMDDEEAGQQFLEFHNRMEKFQSLLGGSTGGKRFCVTRDGRMAIVPPLCQEGDHVVVFSGTCMPFLLRDPNQRGSISDTGSGRCFSKYYELVGCCYVDSAMNGQIRIGEGESFALI